MKELSQLNNTEFAAAVMKLYKESDDVIQTWRKEAKKDYEFYNSHQWLDADKDKLETEGRPVVTFNRVAKVIDAVSGSEVVNRQEARYLPRTMEDVPQTEVYNATAKWVRDLTDAEDEESDAFRDCLICGMGWTETSIDYQNNADGQIALLRGDPLEYRWDSTATARNLTDAGWLIKERWVKRETIKGEWPGKFSQMQPESREAVTENPQDGDAEKYSHSEYTKTYNSKTDEYLLIEIQWWELEPFYRDVLPDGSVGEVQESDRTENSVRQVRRKYYKGFVSNKITLEKGENPINDFTHKCITGKRDKKGGVTTWYGMMRNMRDPQLWANKLFSQILHIFNSSPKGVTFWETGSFAHPDRAAEDINKAEGLVEVNRGAIEKIKNVSAFQIPANVDRMLQYAISAIPDTSGVNPEFLGLADRDQPGVLEFQRTRQALGVLSIMFDSLRRYRKLQGRLMLEFIHKYLTDERIIRIVGPEGEQFVQLTKRENIQYDVIVDDSPTSPNSKTEGWVALQQLMPLLVQAGFPIIPDVLDYMPLPLTITQKWKQAQVRQTEQMQQLQEELKKLQDENLILKAKREERLLDQGTKQVRQILDDDRDRKRLEVEEYEAVTDRLKVANERRRTDAG